MFHPKGPTLFELARQAMSSTEHGYDLIAPKFDWTPFRTPEPIVREIARRVGPVRAALDVCCGTGAAAVALCAECTNRVVGVDTSAGMLEVAAQRLRDAPKHDGLRAELVRADALDLPFANEFDAAVSVGAFGHIEERDEPQFVSSIFRALKPGGRFVFATSELPPWTSPWRVAAEGFNAAMRARNAIYSPPFIMYYLTFLWPTVRGRLLAAGFSEVEATRGAFPAPFGKVLLVTAKK
ncbi:MAG TPA: class I SAM-dependent methyltransferase [Polyangiaceae bacterium]